MAEQKKHSINPLGWVDSYSDQLFRYALSRVSDREKAEDLVQDTFVAALKAKDNFKGNSTEKTWLYSILRNKIIDTYRSKHKNDFVHLDQSDNTEIEDLFFTKNNRWNANKQPSDWDRNAQDEMITEEFYHALQNCTDKLPVKQADAFRMKFLEDLPSDEICKVLDISSSNYWVIIHRAKLVLRDCLDKNWVSQ